MGEAVDFPGLTSFTILLQDFFKPRIGSAIGLREFVQALDGIRSPSPKESHRQLLGVVHVVGEGVTVETNFHNRW